MWIPKEIDSIATRLQNGQRVKRITVRRLLELFDAERRGTQKVQEIKNALNGLNLETEPDFEHAWIDSTIKIRLKGSSISTIDSELDDASDPNEKEIPPQLIAGEDVGDTETLEDSLDGERNDVLTGEDNDSLDVEPELDASEEKAVGQLITEPFDPTQIRIETKQLSLDSLISRMHNNEIILQPEFQRNEVWKRGAQSRLIESLLIRIPIPAFYMDATNDEKWLVVDGQQRLSTLRQFVIDKSDNRLRLTGLEFLERELDGKTFDELERPLQRRIKETNVTVYLIEKGTPGEVKLNVFKRINTGGLPLSAQEIRHALNGSKVNGMLKDLANSPEFLKATGESIRAKRMADREFVVRFFAFLLKRPEDYAERDFDFFLSNTMKRINDALDEEREEWRERFLRAMSRCADALGRYAFRKRITFEHSERLLPVNKALFETWSVNLEALSDDEFRTFRERSTLMWEKFALLLDQRHPFYQAISQGTGDANRVKLRFSAIRQLIQETLA
jgi:hypothetical protein